MKRTNKKSKSMILCILLFMITVLMPLHTEAATDNTTDNAAEETGNRVVRVGYYIAPGFQDYNEYTDEYSGSSYEYLMAIKQYTGWDYEFVPVQFSEGVEMLQEGSLDLMNNVSKTEEREQTLEFSDYASGENYGCLVVANTDTTYAYNDYSTFSKMKVGMLKTTIFKPYFEAFCEEHKITPQMETFETDDEMTKALEDGQIDARIVSSSYRDGSRVVAKFAPMSYYFAVPKGEEDILTELNDAMVSIQTDMPDFSEKLNEKYDTRYVEKNVILSEEEKTFVQEHPIINVAVSNTWYPISYFDQNGRYAGPLANIYQQISSATGLQFQFTSYDGYQAALEAVRSGETQMIAEFPYDFVFADKWKVQLSDLVSKVAIYRVINEDMAKSQIKTIAVYGETYLEEQIRELYGRNVDYIEYANATEAIDAVLSGDVDGTFINYYRSTSFQNKGKYISLKYILMPSLQYDFALGMAEGEDPCLKSLIGKGLSSIDDETLESLFQTTVLENTTPDLEALFYRNTSIFMTMIVISVALIVVLCAVFFYSSRMKKKNMELERAKKAQSDFLSRMSHDMRTPMNGILGLSYLMEKETDVHAVKQYIGRLQESSRYLLQLINDVLDVNKIESGNLELHPSVCDEEAVFDSILDLMQPLIAEKHIHFNFKKINIEWQYMLLDEQRVKQIFINLLNNAVKFTPDGGQIDFQMELISQTEDLIRDKFIIKDSGIGIAPEFLPKIFEPFVQETSTNTDYTSGTGLGLPIVKQLVELMNGTIEVESEKGKGTTITVYLNFPLAKAPTEKKKQNPNTNHKEQVLKPGLHVLLCEDHPLNAMIATKLLEQQKAIVVWAKNGKEGLDLFSQSAANAFDLILMDIRMPLMDGLEATKAIRSLERPDAKTIPIIAMSANAYEEDVRNSIEAGMNAHIAKPIELQKMYNIIKENT